VTREVELLELLGSDVQPWSDEEMAANVARDLRAGSYVNIGIGLPTLVPSALEPGKEVVFHSENGMLGMGGRPRPGEEDPELIDAGKRMASLVRGGAYVNHAESFAIIRGGHLDATIMGAFQVAQNGDMANWSVPGEKLPAVGGAVDLALGVRQVLIMMRHCTRGGEPKLLERCTFPLTALGVVQRIYTDLGIFDVGDECFVATDVAPGVTEEVLGRVTAGAWVWEVAGA
jgi:3-oxoacid CoA-transferase B subunit